MIRIQYMERDGVMGTSQVQSWRYDPGSQHDFNVTLESVALVQCDSILFLPKQAGTRVLALPMAVFT